MPDLGLILASCIWRFWQGSERLTEGRKWLADLLDHTAGSPPAQAKGQEALAGLAYWQADYESARVLYEQLLSLVEPAVVLARTTRAHNQEQREQRQEAQTNPASPDHR